MPQRARRSASARDGPRLEPLEQRAPERLVELELRPVALVQRQRALERAGADAARQGRTGRSRRA